MSGEIVTTCAICGDLVRSSAERHGNLGALAQRALRDMQAHLMTHSFAEVLRFEIRQDLDLVPDEQRPTIVRDIYRSLLGSTRDGAFVLNATDRLGAYTIDEALGNAAMYRLWRTASDCGDPACRQH